MSEIGGVLDVNCVYGNDHYHHIVDVLLPSIKEATEKQVVFNVINYAGSLGGERFDVSIPGVTVRVHSHGESGPIGFAQAHNILAASVTAQVFVIVNPDCVMHTNCIDLLLQRYRAGVQPIGIVEGRQWPFEHPKEYDPVDHTTPWASGAFCLFDTQFYRELGGMDERFFLYLEDVDISWRMWLSGAAVLYEPRAVVTHFSGGPFYRGDLVENEKYYSIRNFVLLMRKFFGFEGEARAKQMLIGFPDQEIVRAALNDILCNFVDFLPDESLSVSGSHRIKVTGINQFHEVRG